MRTSILIVLIALLAGAGYSACAQQTAPEQIVDRLHVPPGFKISVYASDLPHVRSLALGDQGIVYAGSRSDKVYAVHDTDRDGHAEQIVIIAEGLMQPNGVAFKDGSLYVAEINRISRYDQLTAHSAAPLKSTVVFDQLPANPHHGWKYIRFGPDGKLYTAVGSPCNVCEPKQAVYGSLLRLNADGSQLQILAQGIRNSVGFDWQPGTQGLFFSDNGRDYLGDDVPPEELNHWQALGDHFGFPYCHAGDIAEPSFGQGKKCSDYLAPVWRFKAHVAPLGIRFYTGNTFPGSYRNQLFVAQHGSWNRSTPDGYRVALVQFSGGKPVAESVFVDGWLTQDGQVLGRPVDLLTLPDGSLLISDDHAGAIYRVQYMSTK